MVIAAYKTSKIDNPEAGFAKWNNILRTLLLFVAFSLFAAASPLSGQELDATVSVDYSRVSSASTDYLEELGPSIESYLNETDWTSADFQERERIEVTLEITLTAADDSYNYDASLVIRSQRPIYNTLRNTTLLLFNDTEWSFRYAPGQTLVHDELRFDPLTTLLDFYAYLVIGMDFDSFEELGGTPYYDEARNMVSYARSGSAAGWSPGGSSRNRAQLVEFLANPSYRDFRVALYRYHRHGLDRFLENPGEARENILDALELMRDNRASTSGDFLFDLFFNAKYRELASTFEDASPGLREKAYRLLSGMDPGHLSTYEDLQN